MTDATLAAGAAIWRPAADGSWEAEQAEVLLVHRPKYDDWSLPKGKSEPDEHILLTAVREVWEETCVRPVLGPRLPTVEYISWGRPKRVSYWSAFSSGHEAAPGNEIDAVAWVPLGQAREQLVDTHDDPVISAFAPRETVPLILVRHASAGHKADWSGDDEARPLDAQGTADAQQLARLLACFAPTARVISSPTLRCTDTVRPFAASFSGAVEAEASLAPHGRSYGFSSRTDQVHALRQLLMELAAERRPAALCLHRENLGDALAAVCSALGAPASAPADTLLPKGGFWVVHAAAGELAGLERYDLSGA
jgi:8-oxo-(d)GTP phosphatase